MAGGGPTTRMPAARERFARGTLANAVTVGRGRAPVNAVAGRARSAALRPAADAILQRSSRPTRMTAMIPHLADQLRRAFEGGAWHGPAVLELLADVDAARAAWKPPGGAHSIWELTLHIGTWLTAADRRVHGDPAKVTDAEDFPPVAARTATAWAEARTKVAAAFRRLHASILALQPADLPRAVPGHDYDVHFLLDGAIQHSLYHAGQIALLKKMQRERSQAEAAASG